MGPEWCSQFRRDFKHTPTKAYVAEDCDDSCIEVLAMLAEDKEQRSEVGLRLW